MSGAADITTSDSLAELAAGDDLTIRHEHFKKNNSAKRQTRVSVSTHRSDSERGSCRGESDFGRNDLSSLRIDRQVRDYLVAALRRNHGPARSR